MQTAVKQIAQYLNVSIFQIERCEEWTSVWFLVVKGRRPTFVSKKVEGAIKTEEGKKVTPFDLNWNPRRRFEDVAFDVANRVVNFNENIEELIASHYPDSIWRVDDISLEQFRKEIARWIDLIVKKQNEFLSSMPEINARVEQAEELDNFLDRQRQWINPDFFQDDVEYSSNVTLAEVEVTPDLVIAKSFYFAPGLWKHLWRECPEMMKDKNNYKKPSYAIGSSRWECPKTMETDIIKAMISFFGNQCQVVYHPKVNASRQ